MISRFESSQLLTNVSLNYVNFKHYQTIKKINSKYLHKSHKLNHQGTAYRILLQLKSLQEKAANKLTSKNHIICILYIYIYILYICLYVCILCIHILWFHIYLYVIYILYIKFILSHSFILGTHSFILETGTHLHCDSSQVICVQDHFFKIITFLRQQRNINKLGVKMKRN